VFAFSEFYITMYRLPTTYWKEIQMATAIEERVVTDDVEETPAMTLLRTCRNTPTLARHFDIAPALVNKNIRKILNHLYQQRDWFSHLSSDAQQRTSQAVTHARTACAALSNYEMRFRI